jgi:diguanylate cyclase (GGDEF)-like protein/PAS domain S-box-containing protein
MSDSVPTIGLGSELPDSSAARRAARESLGQPELLALAASAPVGLFASVEPYGNVLVNERLCEITGRRVSELLGHGWLDAVHPDDRGEVDAALAVAATDTGELDLEYRVLRPDAEVRWVRARAVRARRTAAPAAFVGSLVDVTEFKSVEAALRSSERRFRALVEQSFDSIVVLERDGRVRYASPSTDEMSGFPAGSMVGKDFLELVHPDDVDSVREALATSSPDPRAQQQLTFRARRADGSWLTIEAAALDLSGDPSVQGVVLTGRDVTLQHEAASTVRASEARVLEQASILEMIATSTPLPETLAEMCRMVESHLSGVRCTVLLVSADGSTLRHGAAPSFPASFARAIDGLPIAEGSAGCGTAAARGEVVMVADLATDPTCAPFADLAREHAIHGCWSVPIRASSDERVLGTFAAYVDEARKPSSAEESMLESVAQLASIAIERSAFEDRLAHQAHHDPLTALPNRTLFGELLEHALRRAQRSGSALAVLFLDLDRFKVVNDSLGHDAGDELLAALAQRLSAALRPGDIVARFGGDEFTVLCEDLLAVSADRQAIGVAERLLDALHEPFLVESEEQFVSASIGIAIGLTGFERPEALVRDADAAMYRAKEMGKGRVEIFDEDMRERARDRHEIENALHRAVARGEFRVFFQPVISLDDGVCIGVEALVRWQHPERGLLAPSDFLAQAEETGLVVPIGGIVLEEACRRGVEWRRSVPDPSRFRVSVNLSGRQLVHADAADLVAGILDRTGLDADALCIEITETVLMEDVDAGIRAVKALKALGVQASIDDFGTGYSALGYLRQFPVDEVKIDRTFVGRLGSEPEDAAIVAAVVSLGHALGVTVTGEGVESTAQLDILRSLGVDAAQGFLFAPPQPADDLTPRLVRPHRWV